MYNYIQFGLVRRTAALVRKYSEFKNNVTKSRNNCNVLTHIST